MKEVIKFFMVVGFVLLVFAIPILATVSLCCSWPSFFGVLLCVFTLFDAILIGSICDELLNKIVPSDEDKK